MARLLVAWFGDRASAYPHLADEQHEALLLIGLLLPLPLIEVYASLSPWFWTWLGS